MNSTTAPPPIEPFPCDVQSLYEHLAQLKDKRDPRGIRYPLPAMLVFIVLAKLCGENEVRGIAEWVKWRGEALITLLNLKHASLPHHTTYSRVLGEAIDMTEFEQTMSDFFNRQVPSDDPLALDGKTLRGTIEPGETQGRHLLALYATSTGVVVKQMEVPTKANEISAAPGLLKGVDLRGRLVTGDAMFAQRTLSEQIVTDGGDYLWVVKDNQPHLRQAIERLFMPESCLPAHSPLRHDFQSATSVDKKHGRLERRCLTSSSLLNTYCEWESLGQVFKVERQVQHLKSGKQTLEVDYGITSLPRDEASPQRLLGIVRGHWAIENGLHYPRDVSLLEDACRLRYHQTPHAMAIVNNLVLGLIHLYHFDSVPQARRFFAAHWLIAFNLILST